MAISCQFSIPKKDFLNCSFHNTYFPTDSEKYEITKHHVLRGKSVPHYAAIEPDGNGLMIVSYKSFKVTSVDQDLEESMDEDRSEKIKGNLTCQGRSCVFMYIYMYVCFIMSSTRAQ